MVAYGAQDAYISGNPQITFWKGLFKRHTNFAMEPFRINFSGQPSWGTKQTAIVGRHADLLYSTYVEVVLPYKGTNDSAYLWSTGSLGHKLIRHVELDIGGQVHRADSLNGCHAASVVELLLGRSTVAPRRSRSPSASRRASQPRWGCRRLRSAGLGSRTTERRRRAPGWSPPP